MRSIIIPSYKGSGTLSRALPGFLQFLKNSGKAFEVIVVDDGSEDEGATEKLVTGLGCRYLANPVNQGKGAAVKRGVLGARGKYVLFTDADIPFQYRNVEEFFNELESGKAEVVVGDRTLAASKYYDEISSLRKWSSSVFTFIVGNFIVKGVYDTQCGIKGFEAETARKIFEKLQIEGFAFDVELLNIARVNKVRIHRLPVELRNNEESTVQVFRHSMQMLRDVLRVKLRSWTGQYNWKS